VFTSDFFNKMTWMTRRDCVEAIQARGVSGMRGGFALSSADIIEVLADIPEPDHELFRSDTEELEIHVVEAGLRSGSTTTGRWPSSR
jgi:hypothetical protein